MTSPAISLPPSYSPHAGHRLSAGGVAAIVAAHAAVLGLLVSMDLVPLPPEVATLMVQVIPPAPPPAPEITPPRPKPVEPKPVPKPAPQPKPVPQQRTLAAETQSPAAVAEAPVVKEAPPPPPAPAPAAPAAPALSQPRFDADYLSNPPPVYPAMSRRLGEEGKVVLRVFVEANGRAAQVEVKTGSGSSRLDQAAEEAVRRWKFVPARRGEEAVGAWVLVPIVFNLRG